MHAARAGCLFPAVMNVLFSRWGDQYDLKNGVAMYLRTTVSLAFGAILSIFSFLTSPAGASTHHHYRYYSHQVRLSSQYLHHARPGVAHLHRRHHQSSSDFTAASVHGPLAAKAREIVAGCGSTVISGWRPGARIAGSGHASLHASGRAVDIKGNPHCIYSHLQGWPGGYSVDYGAVQHVHVSLGGFEDGLRFAHNGSHHRHHRYT
jgi:hypothetical protein